MDAAGMGSECAKTGSLGAAAINVDFFDLRCRREKSTCATEDVRVSGNPHILDADQLRALSGKRSAAAVRRWANNQGIRTLEGADGPWTTEEAVNRALGVGSANDPVYTPDQIA
jgi:hypothetical protein